MAICPIIVHFSTWYVRSMHDVAFEFAGTVMRSKDAQKQLSRTSLIQSCCMLYEFQILITGNSFQFCIVWSMTKNWSALLFDFYQIPLRCKITSNCNFRFPHVFSYLAEVRKHLNSCKSTIYSRRLRTFQQRSLGSAFLQMYLGKVHLI